jgi:hypothetical protein
VWRLFIGAFQELGQTSQFGLQRADALAGLAVRAVRIGDAARGAGRHDDRNALVKRV